MKRMKGNRKRPKTVAMIPARMGSARLKKKNLALISGRPLISYVIEAAKDSGVFDRIIVNSESTVFGNIARRHGVEFYKRPEALATSGAKSDVVVYDFLMKHPSDIVAWVNPTSPLQKGEEIRGVVRHFIEKGLDSLITVKDEQVHCVYKDRPVNFKTDDIFAKTQDLTPVQAFVYSVMMWRTEVFRRTFEKKGRALFCGKVGFYPVNKLSSIIIKKEEDLMLADFLLQTLARKGKYKVKYDKAIR